MEMEKVGVFLCECGPNIREAVDLDFLENVLRRREGIGFIRRADFLCTPEGKRKVRDDIRTKRLTRAVFAACSPKEHEGTFREAAEHGGINPFLIQVANIREQCAWVTDDKGLATDKCKALIEGALRRVRRHDPLLREETGCCADVVVVGAGIAGLSATLTLAQKGRNVYLIEKEPCIGGRTALLEGIFPHLECASCIIEPLLDRVLHHDQIRVFTLSEPREILGYYGNFTIRFRKKARYVDEDTCIGCRACLEACPVSIPNEFNMGMDQRKAVYMPYEGALPNLAVIDRVHCLRTQGLNCSACREACPFGAIDFEDADRMRELEAGAVVLATGSALFPPGTDAKYGYGEIENVVTAMEFERMLNSNGPTGGRVLLQDGRRPERIALIHCVGSRTPVYRGYCSGICCSYLLKFAHQILERESGVEVLDFHSGLCLPGKEAWSLFAKIASRKEVFFISVQEPGAVSISRQDGKLALHYTDSLGKAETAYADMAVLAPAMEGPAEARELARIMEVSLSEGNFFLEEHTNLAPVSSGRRGIFLAGCAQGPKGIQESVIQGQAAAGEILSHLLPGEKLELPPTAAEIREECCSGCKICLTVCPFKAVEWDPSMGKASVNRLLCQGCGLCAAACPGGAVLAKHFTDEQISEEIRGLLGSDAVGFERESAARRT